MRFFKYIKQRIDDIRIFSMDDKITYKLTHLIKLSPKENEEYKLNRETYMEKLNAARERRKRRKARNEKILSVIAKVLIWMNIILFAVIIVGCIIKRTFIPILAVIVPLFMILSVFGGFSTKDILWMHWWDRK